MSSAVPRMPSGPGSMVARVSTMKLVGLPRHVTSGSSGLQRNEDVPLPPLVTRSRPWSKNWPKNVNQALNGARQADVRRDVRE